MKGMSVIVGEALKIASLEEGGIKKE